MERHRHRHVPIDLVAEILVRLPVKSLLQFQCVSKTWRSLILDPSFVHSHRRRSQQKPVFLIPTSGWTWKNPFTIYSLTNEAMLEEYLNSRKETLVEYFKSPDISCRSILMASSRDLLLFQQDINRRGGFFLLNPSTGERLILPESHNFGHYCSFSLDYVPSLGRFKVAMFFTGTELEARTGCEVLVVGVDRSWRPKEDFPFTVSRRTYRAPLLNGAIHMLLSSPNLGIVAFNLHREIWRVIQLPPGFCLHGNISVSRELLPMDLREQRGSLYLSRFSFGKLETWVLKDYEKGNWMMQYNIDTWQLWRMCWYDIENRTRVYPLVIKDDGKLLIKVSTGSVYCYDPEKETFTELGFIPEPWVYAENYLPLN